MKKLKLLFMITLMCILFTACETTTTVEVNDDVWATNNLVIDIAIDYRVDSFSKVYDEETDRYIVVIEFEKSPLSE